MKKEILTLLIIGSIVSTFAQVTNGDFENWNTVTDPTWPIEMTDSHSVENPMRGLINDWSVDYIDGLTRTTDAHTGSYAAVLHNWYNYAETMITYRSSISYYPTNLQGAYKYVSGDAGAFGTARVVVKSTMGDTIINEAINLGVSEQWETFDYSLSQIMSTVDPADSLIIQFRNSEQSCVSNIMTCNLLFLDNITVTNGPLNVNELNTIEFNVFPNPSDGLITIKVENNEVMKIEIIDLLGKTVQEITTKQGKVTMNVSALESGSYIVCVEALDGNRGIKRIVVK